MLAVNEQDIVEAYERIKSYILRTPVLESRRLNETCGIRIILKAEIFQDCGSFKIRGALHAVLSEFPVDATVNETTSICCHSSGNHASAVALAARLRGVKAHIIVPKTTPKVKRDLVETYGGQLHFCDPTIDAREKLCAAVQSSTGSSFIHPYNDPRVIAGQGTIALELLEQAEDLDAIIVPVSGGGMISGIATFIKSRRPSVLVIAAEPRGTNDAADVHQAKTTGMLPNPPLSKPQTVADGLQGRLGTNTWPIVKDLVDGVIVVDEEEIVESMKLCYMHAKVVVEPSGAVGLAAVRRESRKEGGLLAKCKTVAVILCGGNVDLESKGLWDMNNWKPAD